MALLRNETRSKHFPQPDALLIQSLIDTQIAPVPCVFHMKHKGGIESGRHRIQSFLFFPSMGLTEESGYGL